MTPRAKKALEVLKSGGYFRKQLESTYKHGEQFKMRLRDANGYVVAGIGPKTFYELEDAKVLKSRPCASSSVWPEEYELVPVEVVEAPYDPLEDFNYVGSRHHY